jgi:hypothetical protein
VTMQNRDLDYYRVRYAAAIDPQASPRARRRAYLALASQAKRIRCAGVPDADNHAVQVQREFGIAPRDPGFPTLERLGLLATLRDAGIRRRPLFTLDRFLASLDCAVADATRAHVDTFLAKTRPGTARRMRGEIRRCYVELIARGLAKTNPAALRERVGRRSLDTLTPALREDHAKMVQLGIDELASPATQKCDFEYFWGCARWMLANGHTETTIASLVWNDAAALEKLTRWWARPLPSGHPRSASVLSRHFTFMTRLLRAWGYPSIEASDKMRLLKRPCAATAPTAAS